MKKLLFICFTLSLFSLMSCSKDDATLKTGEQLTDIVGTWKILSANYHYCNSNGCNDNIEDFSELERFFEISETKISYHPYSSLNTGYEHFDIKSYGSFNLIGTSESDVDWTFEVTDFQENQITIAVHIPEVQISNPDTYDMKDIYILEK